MTLLSRTQRLCLGLVFIGAVPTSTIAADPRGISELLAKVANGPLDPSIFFELESQSPDARVFAGLADAFQKKESKEDRQLIALTLLHLGDASERYFELLAQYAKVAIEDRTPPFFVYGPSGEIIRGEMSFEFKDWCRVNQRDPREMAAVQFLTYPEDVRLLASAQDDRARTLLIRGLASPNPLVVYYSAEGLALLRDMTALPLIVETCARLSPASAHFVAKALALYFTPEADLVLERFVREPDFRARYKRDALQRVTVEMSRKVARQKGRQ